MGSAEPLARQIDEALRALPDRSTAALRKERRRWSASLKPQPADEVVALAIELFERYGHRWIAYDSLTKNWRSVRSRRSVSASARSSP